MKLFNPLLVLAIIFCAYGAVQADVFSMPTGLTSLEFVPVGNAGNTADTRYLQYNIGAVDYTYNIGKFEVTAGQYCQFLNAVAKTDTYGLYDTEMDTSVNSWGCNIQRSYIEGIGYSYSVAADWANRPVGDVSWGDAARFCNWLTNGQPTGAQDSNSTESGSYMLNGATTNPEYQAASIRQIGARYVIPTDDEWYKAAYYKGGGANAGYWDYPTRSNEMPSNVLSSTGSNNANHMAFVEGYQQTFSTGSPYWRTEVGAFENTFSPYGAFDMGGNLNEWNEELYLTSAQGTLSGGSWDCTGDCLGAWDVLNSQANARNTCIGFRVAEVPEPATMAILALGGVALLRRKSGYGG